VCRDTTPANYLADVQKPSRQFRSAGRSPEGGLGERHAARAPGGKHETAD
jgi:hypothetical protein